MFSPKTKKILLFVSGPLLGVGVFVLINRGFMVRDETVVALVWSIFAYVICQHFVQFVTEEETSAEIRREIAGVRSEIVSTSEAFKNDLGSQSRIGLVTNEEFDNKLSYAIASAHHVKNTYVGIRDITGSKTLRGKRVLEYYKSVLTKEESSWEDLMGVGEFLDGRVAHVYECVGEEMRGEYRQSVFSTHAPIFNFILMGPKGPRMTDVFFGWVKAASTEIDMFHSKDPRVILMFENYFSSLKAVVNRIAEFPPSFDRSLDHIDRSSYCKFQGTWLSVSGSPDIKPGSVHRYSIMEFRYTDDWHISGTVFSRADQKMQYSIESDFCILIDNVLYYRYHNFDEYGKISSFGIGAYALSGGEDRLKGYYVIKDRTLATLKAIKIPDQPFDHSSVDQHIESLLA